MRKGVYAVTGYGSVTDRRGTSVTGRLPRSEGVFGGEVTVVTVVSLPSQEEGEMMVGEVGAGESELEWNLTVTRNIRNRPPESSPVRRVEVAA